MASCMSWYRLLLPAAVLMIHACSLAAAIRTGLVPLEVDEPSQEHMADQQHRQLLQTASRGATTISPAAAANPSAPPHPQPNTPASPSPAISNSLMTSSSPAPVSNGNQPTQGSSLEQTQSSIPASNDGCQYIRGLQFEGQLSAYDEGFKFTKFTLSNLDKLNGIIGTYWELRAASTPQDCCQLCQISNKTHAAAAAAEATSTSSQTSGSGDQPVNNTTRDPCLYFTWVPRNSEPRTQLRNSAAPGPGSEAATTQQRVTTPGLTGVTSNRAHQAAGGSNVIAMDGPGVNGPGGSSGGSVAGGATSDGQGGACLLVGGGFSWVDAEKSDFGAVSGLLYPG